MATITVHTQAEYDAAFEKHKDDWSATIIIDAPRGVWIAVPASGSATVMAYDSATVRASGSATVEAYDSATVRASGSATVRAYDSATVRASGSATVRAYDSATVRAYDSATVRASGSATVRAYDSATVRASGSATVRAYDSATVRASGSATVRAYDSATVMASRFVAVHLWSQRVTLSGGVVIDLTALDPKNLDDWCDYTGTKRDGDTITVYKAVDDGLKSGYQFTYPIGEAVEDTKWRDDHECGGGLHFSPTPTKARSYFGSATRFLECTVHADDVRTIGWDKLKAPRATVVREVTIDGEPVAS